MTLDRAHTVKSRFTGYHITAIFVTFFAVVIAVNFTMATLAVKGFGGTVVDNSYVASQQFNGWLAASRAQAKLGWHESVSLNARRQIGLTLTDAHGALLPGAQITGHALHPLGSLPDRPLHFAQSTAGHYVASEALPAGRWQVALTVQHDGHTARIAQEVN